MDGSFLKASRAEGAVRVVYSPDDGGYYLSEFDLPGRRTRVSKKVWATEAAAARAWRQGAVKWERWN